MKLFFEKGPLFYLFFNIRLLLFLLFHKCDLLVSNDLDTLIPNYFVSKLKKIPLVYDTHEIFTEVPELQHNRLKKRIWKGIERVLVPRLKYLFTVNKSIADWYQVQYHVSARIVRNVPTASLHSTIKSRLELDLPVDKQIIILQGSGINIDRGAEELIESMKFIENSLLLIIGGGDCIPELKKRVIRLDLKEKVRFVGKLPYSELMQYTRNSDLGVTFDKNTNINYYYSLPNKLFDYIHAGIPVLASRLPEIEKIIRHYDLGDLIDNHEPRHIADKIEEVLKNQEQVRKWKENTKLAARELVWETEEKELISVYKNFI